MNSLLDQLITWRRHLHQNPELSFQEYETQAYLWQQLERLDGIYLRKAANTGIIADLITDTAGPWIALRADMDALPMEETPERPYRSLYNGRMHACGHDAHMAILLGAIYLLYQQRAHWKGGIRCIFQPGEEKAPGGASLLLQEGILQEVPIQGIWGLHVTPQLPVGQIGLRSGAFMAASDEFSLILQGRGGHAAYPHLSRDLIAIGASLIMELQMVVSRAADPRSPTVLSFGQFQAGTAANIFPTQAHLRGTLRTFDEKWRQDARALIQRIVSHTATAWEIEAELTFLPGYPVLQNDPTLTALTRRWVVELLGEASTLEMPLWLGSEDFAFYSHVVPACFMRLGTGGEHPHTRLPVHTPAFDIDERGLEIGARLFAHIALRALAHFQAS
ncbi:MAG: M20 family metallopeptidase [Bacteroidia bacterium]|nr:M20 family metallopeptidase [Bacteroidia bacterium]MDW8235326.1 M20 family metallopeptidase [Bacteroidia bacterium]